MTKNLYWLYQLEVNLKPENILCSTPETTGLMENLANLKNDIQTFRMHAFTKITVSKKFVFSSLAQLTTVSDSIYYYLINCAPAWRASSLAPEIHSTYKQVLKMLQGLMDAIIGFARTNNIDVYRQMPLSRYNAASIRAYMRAKLSAVNSDLQAGKCSSTLRKLFVDRLKQLLNKPRLTYLQLWTISGILSSVQSARPRETLELIILLFQYNFNKPTFIRFLKMYCRRLLQRQAEPADQLSKLYMLEDMIKQICETSSCQIRFQGVRIEKMMLAFVRREKQYIQQQMHHNPYSQESKRQVNLSVPQLGLLARLQVETGIFSKEDIGATFQFFAQHYTTPRTSFISASSLQKKSLNIDTSSAMALKSILLQQINWINKRFD